MIHEETKAMVKKLGSDDMWTAFGGLSKEEQEFLKANKKHAGIVGSNGKLTNVGNCGFSNEGAVYRLLPDFVLPEEKKRWWYNKDTKELICQTNESLWLDEKVWVEVPADYVEYVEGLIIILGTELGDYEFRKTKDGDIILCGIGSEYKKTPSHITEYAFVRKQPAEVKPSGYVDGFVMLSGVEVPCKVRVKEESK